MRKRYGDIAVSGILCGCRKQMRATLKARTNIVLNSFLRDFAYVPNSIKNKIQVGV